MKKFPIAHIKEQGVDLIIIPLDSSFGRRSERDQSQIINKLQDCASSAKLIGTVVPVWQDGQRMMFIAPNNWHPFFKSLTWSLIQANINKELLCPQFI